MTLKHDGICAWIQTSNVDAVANRIEAAEADSHELAEWKKLDSFYSLATVGFLQSLVREFGENTKDLEADVNRLKQELQKEKGFFDRMRQERDTLQAKLRELDMASVESNNALCSRVLKQDQTIERLTKALSEFYTQVTIDDVLDREPQ